MVHLYRSFFVYQVCLNAMLQFFSSLSGKMGNSIALDLMFFKGGVKTSVAESTLCLLFISLSPFIYPQYLTSKAFSAIESYEKAENASVDLFETVI